MAYFLFKPLFNLGNCYCTQGVHAAGIDPTPLIHRHHCGDWGDVCDEDSASNFEALESGERIVSKYSTTAPDGCSHELFIITEADRSSTTVLLTEEY